MFASLLATWQDVLVTVVAAAAAATVVWRTLGTWQDSRPGSKTAPHCDNCALKEQRRTWLKSPSRTEAPRQ